VLPLPQAVRMVLLGAHGSEPPGPSSLQVDMKGAPQLKSTAMVTASSTESYPTPITAYILRIIVELWHG
jgi:hypothetical protein